MSRAPSARVVTAVLAVTLSGCSLDSRPALRPAAPGARAGGELLVAITAPGSLDPANAYDEAAKLVISTMCDSLVQLDPATGRTSGGLASSFIVSAKGHTLTLTLTKKATFSDGTPVTSRDVLFSLSRVAGADYGSPNAHLLSEVSGYPVLHGDEPTTKKTRATRELSGVRIVSDTAFAIDLVQPDTEFVRTLSLPFATAVPRALVASQADAFSAKPVCSGPYRLTEPYEPGAASITLERTPGYSGVGEAYSAGGRGYADRIVFRVFADRASAMAAYAKGLVDLVRVPAGNTLRGLQTAPLPAVEYVGVPLTSAPFDQPLVRQALSQALDRTTLADGLLKGARLPATGLLPPTMPRGESKGCGPLTPATADLAAARASLTRAGISLTGVKVPFYFNDELGNRAVVEAISTSWQRAFGMQARPTALSWRAFLARATRPGGFDGPFRLSWSVDTPSRYAFLQPLFASDQIGQANLERFRSGSVDKALDERIAKQVDDGERDLAADQLERDLCAELPLIPVTVGAAHWAVRTAAVGVATDALLDHSSGLPVLRELYVRAKAGS